MSRLYDEIVFHNNTTPALNEDNLNSMSHALAQIDKRVDDGFSDIEIAKQSKAYADECKAYADSCEGYVDDCEEIYNKVKEFDFDNGEVEDF